MNTSVAGVAGKAVGGAMSGLSSQALAGSRLGEALRTAGVKSGTWAKDPTTGKFMSQSKINDLVSSSLSGKGKK